MIKKRADIHIYPFVGKVNKGNGINTKLTIKMYN